MNLPHHQKYIYVGNLSTIEIMKQKQVKLTYIYNVGNEVTKDI